jgi:DMSO/TMAO reductase YedYZ molybdopterin-dependent catalytic subunit
VPAATVLVVAKRGTLAASSEKASMRRVTTRLVLTALITVAFVLTAASGLVLYVPGRVPTLGISLLGWRTIHNWSALVLTAAVAAHVVYNRRRLGEMLARSVRSPRRPQPAAVPAPRRPQDPGQDSDGRAAAASGASPGARLNRRSFLVAALGLQRGLWRRIASATSGLAGGFPVLNVESEPPPTDAASWVVEVDGLVDSPQRVDRSAWLALPRSQETRDFHCVEGWSVGHLGWEGVRVADLLSLAGPQAGAQFVTFHAYGGTYSDSLSLAEARAPETLLADSLNGGPLPPAHGGPLRLVVPSQLGYKNVKWVVRLEVTAKRTQGYWEARGYPAEAPVG